MHFIECKDTTLGSLCQEFPQKICSFAIFFLSLPVIMCRKDKKIAIVTWLGWGNFGTSLQSYALHQTLSLMGYEVCILLKYSAVNTLKALLRRLLPTPVRQRCVGRRLRDSREASLSSLPGGGKLQRFHSESYNVRPYYRLLPQPWLRRAVDVYLTGSDQIWNTYFSFDPLYFLTFAGDRKRVAYASSLGVASVHPRRAVRVKAALQAFAHIAVREETGAEVLRRLTDREDIRTVLDPTFLLSRQSWSAMAAEAEIEIALPERYVLAYFVGDRPHYASQLQSVMRACGVGHAVILPAYERVVAAPDGESREMTVDGAMVYRHAAPREFVRLVERATAVCTDSFHAACLSMIFEKDFVVTKRFDDGDKLSQNSRIYDLLRRFGLQSRILDDKSGAEPEWRETIDYARVTPLIEAARGESRAYLKHIIEE